MSLPYLLVSIIFVFFITVIIFLLKERQKLTRKIDDQNKTLQASRRIYQLVLEDLEFEAVVQKIADAIPQELKFGTGVVAVIDEANRTIRRVAASKTMEAQSAIQALSIPFNKIEISLDDPNNLMARALREHKSFTTASVYDVLGPVLSNDESEKIQRIMGTKTTLVYPIFLKSKPIGVFIASTKKEKTELSEYEFYIINDFVNLVGLVLQNSKLFTSLKETSGNLSLVNQEVYKMNTKLHELDRLKDDFVSVASHELRTPMTAIRSYAWMALFRPDMPLTDKMKKYLERVLVSTERLINLVNDMLNISRIESGRVEIIPSVFDIIGVTKEIASDIEVRSKEKELTLQVIETRVPQVFADEDKVRQVLLNLLGNSLKFTPPHGIITISFFSDGQFVEISVKDTGVGIPEDDLPRLFKKFSRLDNTYVATATSGGTGLGLYICKSLIDMMGGRIWVKSDGISRGATFSFSLPVATKETLAQAYMFTKRTDGNAKLLEPTAI